MPARARLAMVAWAASALLVALVASVPGSSLHPLLPTGAVASGPLAPLARALGLGGPDGDGAAFASAVSSVLAAATFAWLMVEAWRGGVRLRVVLACAVVAQVAVLALPLLLSRDVYSYAMYGRISAFHHANPYVVAPSGFPDDPFASLVSARWMTTPSVYGPLFTSLSAALVRISDDVGVVVMAFRMLASAAGVATTLMIVSLARRVAPGREAFAVAAFGMNPVIVFHAIGGGHNDLLVAFGVVAAALL